MFRLIAKIRKAPHHVKQNVVFLASIATIMAVALVWGALLLMRFFTA